jgi:hypothetical protein
MNKTPVFVAVTFEFSFWRGLLQNQRKARRGRGDAKHVSRLKLTAATHESKEVSCPASFIWRCSLGLKGKALNEFKEFQASGALIR